jgi:F-type H+-transporting ATPase subunit c
MLYLSLAMLAAGLGVPLACLGAALGQGKVGASAVEGVARQPEAAGRIQMVMIIALALIESLAIYSLLISMIIIFVLQLPKGSDIVNLIVQGKIH